MARSGDQPSQVDIWMNEMADFSIRWAPSSKSGGQRLRHRRVDEKFSSLYEIVETGDNSEPRRQDPARASSIIGCLRARCCNHMVRDRRVGLLSDAVRYS